jgi:hypothetical protein
MNENSRRPPRLAAWLLRRLCSNSYGESLGGDLLERFHEGQSDSWFRRQVAIAILANIWNEVRPRPFHVAFAAAGTAVLLLRRAPIMARLDVRWPFVWGLGLGWPWSTVFDIGFGAILNALWVVPTAAAVIVFDWRFTRQSSWRGGLRTVLIGVPTFAVSEVAAIEWLPHFRSVAIMHVLGPAMLFVTLLMTACVGFRARRGSREQTPLVDE